MDPNVESGRLQSPYLGEGDASNYNLQIQTSVHAGLAPPCDTQEPGLQVLSEPRRSTWYPCCSCRGKNHKPKEDERGFEASIEAGETHSVHQTRKWKYFPGNNHFYCGGRIMTAPSIRYSSLSLALILLTFGLFLIFDVPYLTKNVTVTIPIVSSILFVLVIVNMLRTSCSDPGILPRATLAEVEDMERSYGTTAATYRPPPRTKDIIVNGQTVKSKYCFTCKMFRPPRASHCSICDNCVERFDHHCPFLGNCVGRRNYRSFYFFVVSLSLLAVLILSCAVTHLALLVKENGNFLEALRISPTSAVVIIISFFGMWTVIGLAGFHTYLIAVEQTTNEDIKGLFGRPNSKNPYSRGNTCRNCCFILCGPNPPSLLDPRGYATPDFLESMQKPNTAQTQQPVRAAATAMNSVYTGPQAMGVPSPKPMDISHIPHQQLQQSVPLRQIYEPVTNPQLRISNGIQEPPKAGTFPDSTRYGEEYETRLTNGRSTSHSRSPSDSKSNVPVSTSETRNKNSRNSIGGSFAPSPALVQRQRVNNNKTNSSPSNGILKSPSSLEQMTMINSPLALDPVF